MVPLILAGQDGIFVPRLKICLHFNFLTLHNFVSQLRIKLEIKTDQQVGTAFFNNKKQEGGLSFCFLALKIIGKR